MSIQQRIIAFIFFHQERIKKKKYFRRLWITRINALNRKDLIFYSYNKLIKNMYQIKFLLNRKILTQIILSNKNIPNKINLKKI